MQSNNKTKKTTPYLGLGQMKPYTFRLPVAWMDDVDELAKADGVKSSQIVREGLKLACRARGRDL